MPSHGFDAPFAESQFSFRLSHYPPVEADTNQFGIAPHTDANFMTFLAQSDVPGLQVRMPDGTWVDVPYVPGSFAKTEFAYPGDRSVYTTNLQIDETGESVRQLNSLLRGEISAAETYKMAIDKVADVRDPGNAGTVIRCAGVPPSGARPATLLETRCTMPRTWLVRLPAMKFTLSVRSFHVPATPRTCA